ncbi:DUF485 domain-containing protein [Antribacter sp. KLBMP9083]|uniref:DUF485 domain-containing protein n=1 Tax=Antribacter soli TaxID=2910976 RepID=A0AA41QAV3_9MICO|nr:DUF485 domain-containing protein [Antribacter soli]MCF4119752.1 DUF485 domain-containing protein [Antribacter soli]
MSDLQAEEPAETAYQRVERSEEFQGLKRTFRNFVFPWVAIFLVWYFAYVLLANYAHDFMSTRIGDSSITVALVLGLGQFASTFAITMLYASWANKKFDPHADALREEIEGENR